MSDPIQQRADGCSIFITVILVIAASVIFLSIHHFLSPEQESSASQIIDEQRKEKISQHAEESKNFAKKVNGYHLENNSSFESSMKKVIEGYKPQSE